ncbi:NADP-specific glutamate dehydrogenase [Sulfurovum sp. ST-21]|uniref:Glutamate dehydrogenase n=1 Tax=Sulfurovum indicum TaxID=2779528 RepID=A0A7M1S4S4_9BACT|nr:NADP-specific glutamate dehydrogenase [Sulfurovum indicum]QOR62358.1 NADP-specific glutamate dehydrogenase [Sulfurovum indicum]
MSVEAHIKKVLHTIESQSPGQKEFYQAAHEVLYSLMPLLKEDERYDYFNILERITVPERTIIFKVNWVDDHGRIKTNFGYRVQFNSAIGPYKGGLRFHPTVNLGIVKFLGFEQVFKNALTGLQIGGAKGGSNFDPKGKSDNEIMRFCQAFMTELYPYIGETQDIPAGDIGVGPREIGYLFGQYKKITRQFEGVLTGKDIKWGGSNARKEATGYGSVYFAENILNKYGESLEGKRCCVSGSGNVAIYTIEKLYEMGATPVSCSDSKGTIYHENGIDLNSLKAIKEINYQSLEVYAQVHPDAVYTPVSHYPDGRHMVWDIPCDIAFPSATQNELNLEDAKKLVDHGCMLVNEGANMPTTPKAMEYLKEKGVWFGPGKAANAGGVTTSQLEMSQNASMAKWSFEEVDIKLRQIMRNIFDTAYETSVEFDCEGDLVSGANISGFRKVADSMIDQGSV